MPKTEFNILLVDDEDAILGYLSQRITKITSAQECIIEKVGITTANTIEKALDYIKANSVDLALVDYVMPGNTLEVVNQLKLNGVQHIVMISGTPAAGKIAGEQSIGFLRKPIDNAHLEEILRTAMTPPTT
jgi:CheY-like chemotaxis protein